MEKRQVNTIHIFKEAAVRIPRKKILALYTDILRKHCSLSLIFITGRKSALLNRYRGKKGPANILTFPTDSTAPAEIYINTDMLRRNAKEAGTSVSNRIIFLAIHGMLHLLGYRHNETMEQKEDEYAAKYM